MHDYIIDVSVYLQKDVIAIRLTGWLPLPHVSEDYPQKTWNAVRQSFA